MRGVICRARKVSYSRGEAPRCDTLPGAQFPVPQRGQAACCSCKFCFLPSAMIYEEQPHFSTLAVVVRVLKRTVTPSQSVKGQHTGVLQAGWTEPRVGDAMEASRTFALPQALCSCLTQPVSDTSASKAVRRALHR